MIGLKKRDIKKALKAGAKAGGMSVTDVRANIVNIIFTKNVNLKITRNVNLLLPVLLTYVYLFRPFLVFQHIHKILGSI